MLKLLFQVLSMASPLSEEQSPNLVLCHTMILLIYLGCISTQSGISFTFFVAKTFSSSNAFHPTILYLHVTHYGTYFSILSEGLLLIL